MLPHGDRHLPCVQRPHTRCHSTNTRSLTHSCLTYTHHPHGGTHPRCLLHTPCLSHTHGGTHPRCLNHTGGFAHTCRFSRARGFFPLRAPLTHGMPGSTHAGTLATTPLAHGVSLARGVSLAHGVALGVSFAHGIAFTHALLLPVCVRRSTHFHTLVYTHRDTTHTGTTLVTTQGTTLTLGILATT